MKNTSYTVNSISAAWAKVNEIFPSDYNKDEASSERAGYNVYRSPLNHYDYICDLGDRLEVNLANGETVNIWIKEEEQLPELPAKEDIKKAAAHQYTFEPEAVQLIRVFVDGDKYESVERQRVYKAMRKTAEDRFWLFNIAGDMASAYCDAKGIEWGTIRVISVTHYSHGKTDNGHFVIEAIVTERTKA